MSFLDVLSSRNRWIRDRVSTAVGHHAKRRPDPAPLQYSGVPEQNFGFRIHDYRTSYTAAEKCAVDDTEAGNSGLVDRCAPRPTVLVLPERARPGLPTCRSTGRSLAGIRKRPAR